ncbi:MAG: hypothetical protein ACLFUR_05885 [Candidatus Hadarchaeia archaeon]
MIKKVLGLCLLGKESDEKKKKEKTAEVVDRVIKKNKKTFDELAKR